VKQERHPASGKGMGKADHYWSAFLFVKKQNGQSAQASNGDDCASP
jgi:hypothetical protein